jgi:hypothetical protein
MTVNVGQSPINTTNLILDLDPYDPRSFNTAENIILYSSALANTASWFFDNAATTTNNVIAPDGTLTGGKLTSSVTGGNNQGFIQQVVGVASNTVFTYSVYLKQGSSPTSLVDFFIISPYTEINATVTWGATPSIAYGFGGAANASTRLDSSFTDAGNGWWRVSMTINSGSGTSFACRVYVRGQGTNNVSGEYVYMWGPQLEKGYGPSPYVAIPAGTATTRPSVSSNNYSTLYVGTLNGQAQYTRRARAVIAETPAFQFNGSVSDYISSYSIPASVFQGSYTASFWFRMNDIRTDNALAGHGIIGVSQGLHLGVRNTQPYFGFYGNDMAGTASMVTDTWYNLVFTYNAQNFRRVIYRNGIFNAEYTNQAYIGTGTNFEIGRYPWVTNYNMNGYISKVQLYNTDFNAADVASHFNTYRGRYGI